MRYTLFSVVSAALLLGTTGCINVNKRTETVAQSSTAAPAKARGRLVHMVAFKFKETATPEQIRLVETEFAALPSKIPVIRSYEAGTNVSPEGFNRGFTHGFILTFASAADRDAYLVHPDHKKFAEVVGPVLAPEGVFVIDFWAH